MASVNEEAANKRQPRSQFSCGEEKTNRRGGKALSEGEEWFLIGGPL